jgi:vitellogenic carboxypeptidase-like protein
MKLVFILLFAAVISLSSAKIFLNPYPRFETHDGRAGDFDGDDDGPLLITPFLKAGKDVKEIQKMAAIDLPDLKDFPGYSGFITVNESTNANMFFWYFPAAAQSETAPVVLWLQGGPGASSLFGLFTENGPFEGN